MTDPQRPVVAAFLAAGTAARTVIADPATTERWTARSRLTGFTVGGLAAHLARAVTVVEEYLRTEPGPDAERVDDSVAYYRSIDLPDDPADPVHAAIRGRGEDAAAVGPAAVIEGLDRALARLGVDLPQRGSAERIAVVGGRSIPVDEYLVTRIVELLVHTDDLATDVEADPPMPDPGAADLAIGCLIGLARDRAGDVEVLRALSRRERAVADRLLAF